jgi:hypothetical protein
MCKKLHEERLLAKLSAVNDIFASSAKYHKILAHLYKRVRALDRKQHAFKQNDQDHIHGLVFA